jgi:hypothetical protein
MQQGQHGWQPSAEPPCGHEQTTHAGPSCTSSGDRRSIVLRRLDSVEVSDRPPSQDLPPLRPRPLATAGRMVLALNDRMLSCARELEFTTFA